MDRAERQRAISQQLLSPAVLERVAREEGLAAARPVEDVVLGLRNRVVVDVDSPLPRNRAGAPAMDSFRISYTDRTPDRAQRVTNRLATVFVQENSRSRARQAEGTSEFLSGQLAESRKRLDQLQAKLRQAKETYMGRLPEQTDANLQMANGLRQQLEATSNALRGEQDRLTMIEAQVQALEQGAASALVPEPQGIHGRIRDLEEQLANARARGYKDKHPEIIMLQEELASARADLDAAKEQPADARLERLQTDPVYRRLTTDRDASRLRINELQRAMNGIQQQIGVYQHRVEQAPMVDQALTTLQREYELEEAQHKQLSTKYQAALQAEDVQRRQGGEQFSILYPAYLPTKPISPDPMKLMLMALALGLCLGAASVAGIELLDRSVHDVRALQQEFAVPVLGEIPHIERLTVRS
jgi:polysaccharide chain length determinant protein (PEP-CTERM system associated)